MAKAAVKSKSPKDVKVKMLADGGSQDPVRLYLKEVGKTPLLNHAKEVDDSADH